MGVKCVLNLYLVYGYNVIGKSRSQKRANKNALSFMLAYHISNYKNLNCVLGQSGTIDHR